jgi:hypothetical protein
VEINVQLISSIPATTGFTPLSEIRPLSCVDGPGDLVADADIPIAAVALHLAAAAGFFGLKKLRNTPDANTSHTP